MVHVLYEQQTEVKQRRNHDKGCMVLHSIDEALADISMTGSQATMLLSIPSNGYNSRSAAIRYSRLSAAMGAILITEQQPAEGAKPTHDCLCSPYSMVQGIVPNHKPCYFRGKSRQMLQRLVVLLFRGQHH